MIARTLIFFLFLILNFQAYSQDFSGSMVSFGGGPSFPSKSGGSTGFNLFFSYGRILNKNIGIRGDLMLNRFTSSSSAEMSMALVPTGGSIPVIQTVRTETESSEAPVGLKLDALIGNFNNASRMVYFGTFGLGFGNASWSVDQRFNIPAGYSMPWNVSRGASGSDFSFSFGMGGAFGYRISRKTAVMCEASMETLKDITHFPVRFGFTFLPSLAQ